MEGLDARGNSDSGVDIEGNVAMDDGTKILPFDIETLYGSPTCNELEKIVRAGSVPLPRKFQRYANWQLFPLSVLLCNNENGEKVKENCWCLVLPRKHCIALSWRENGEKVKENCWCLVLPKKHCIALSWRELQTRLQMHPGVGVMVEERFLSEIVQWEKLLCRIIDLTIFLGERGLAFCCSSLRIGDVHNGNFLGILELLAHYDQLLQKHISKVKTSKQTGERLQALKVCAARVRGYILKERENAKYF